MCIKDVVYTVKIRMCIKNVVYTDN
jgi:hypothetical protein